VIVSKTGEIARDNNGDIIMEWSPSGANQALRTIAKLRGDFFDTTLVEARSMHLVINGVNMEDLT
jgi:hypothetical protein